MFESTTPFDFDDDVILETSFKPITSSTQASQVAKRGSEVLHKGNSKKPRCDEGSTAAGNRDIPIQREISVDTFALPNRVVKRKFPGPAGLLPELGASNKSILQLLGNEKLKNDSIEDIPILSQQTNSVFENGPWKEMCNDFQSHNGENLVEKFNIKWIKKQAFKQLLNHKAPFLAAIIQNFDIVDGKIPTINVTLKDTTGDIRGTILHSLYEEHSSYFRIGSVLTLKHFGVLSAGYNNHCLTITPNNLISIYCGDFLQKLPNEINKNVYGESSSEGSVKKIIIQDCNAGDIFKKYNEDILTYSQEIKDKPNLGNLYRNNSNNNINNNSPIGNKLMTPYTNRKPQPSGSNTSTVVFSTNTRNDDIRSDTSPEESWTSSTDAFQCESFVKKFNYKKPLNSITSSKKIVNVNSIYTNCIEIDQEAKTCDNVFITSNKISVTPDNKEHTEIWKNLLEGVDTDSLFDDF